MLELVFRLCCGIITAISYLTGYSYEVINTFLFIYLEPLILIVTGCMITYFGIKYRKSITNKIILGLSVIYNAIIIVIIGAIWKHYSQFDMQTACERAYIDLDTLGRITGLGYINVNLLLFILLFLAILAFNIITVVFQKKSYRKLLLRERNENMVLKVI